MKKNIPALAALAFCGIASAQSSVTLFGVVDASVTGYASRSEDRRVVPLAGAALPNQGSVTVGRTVLANSAYNSSRVGFRGTEDLGGGLAASFWLESAISNDDGQTGLSTFGRRATVSLSGAFGEVRIGRDYTPTFWNDAVFDPFNTNGVGTNLILSAHLFNPSVGPGGYGGNANYLRASNSVAYFLPALGGFYGQAMYAFSEQTKYDPGTATPDVANNSRAGRYLGGRFGYASGPLDVAFAYGESTTGDRYFAGVTQVVKIANLGASYDFGPVKLYGEMSRARNQYDSAVPVPAGTADTVLRGYLVGLSVPVGPGLFRAAYSRVTYENRGNATPFGERLDPKAGKLAIGYVHNLSKRTALYATVARINNSNGAALTVGGPAFLSSNVFTPTRSTGYDLGIRHAF